MTIWLVCQSTNVERAAGTVPSTSLLDLEDSSLADTGCLLDTREWMKEQRSVRSLSVQLVLETPSLELHDPVLILEKH